MAILRVSDKVLSAILLSAFSLVLDLSTTDMGNNSNKMRDKKPWTFTEVKNKKGLTEVFNFIRDTGGLEKSDY